MIRGPDIVVVAPGNNLAPRGGESGFASRAGSSGLDPEDANRERAIVNDLNRNRTAIVDDDRACRSRP
jgi:hypothetical protein